MPRPALVALALSLSTAAVAQTPEQAQPYLEAAARGDIFEITTSQMALMKSQDPMVRQYAQRMISDHTLATNNALAAATAAGVVPPPAVLNDQQRQQITQLLGASGAQFNRLYWQMQTASHQQALTLQRNYAAEGDTEQLRTFASRIAPVIAEHLEDARRHSAM